MEYDASGDAMNQKFIDRLTLLCPKDFNHPPGLLSILLFAICTDSHYYLIQDDSTVQFDVVLPSSWVDTSLKLFQCKFQPIGYSDCMCLFSNLVMGNNLISNLISQKTKSVFSKCFPINKYVPFPDQPSISLKFANTKELRSIFTDNVILPARSSELLAAGFVSGSLIGLPEEIITKIMILCGGVSTAKLSLTNTRFRNIAANQSLWKIITTNEYKSILASGKKPISDWYGKYKECHMKKHSRKMPLEIVFGRR